MLHLFCNHLAIAPYDIYEMKPISKDQIAHKPTSATSKLPTQPSTPNIFSSFSLGAFELANLDSSLFFWLTSYLSLPLSLP